MAGMHIINDRLYGAFAIEGQKGHCLHSYAAAFNHPISGDSVEIRTQLPDWADLRSARE
jgi:23S rRNA-/tRNA-specific pseudouridylate synthase